MPRMPEHPLMDPPEDIEVCPGCSRRRCRCDDEPPEPEDFSDDDRVNFPEHYFTYPGER